MEKERESIRRSDFEEGKRKDISRQISERDPLKGIYDA